MPAIRLLIRGKVQGVFFRASARREALRIGLTGWVRNTDEGHVELYACGSQPDLEALIVWCHQGPPSAKVVGVDVEARPEAAYEGFEVLR